MNTSTGFRTGLVLCGLIGLLDVAALAGMGRDDAPPWAIGLGSAVLGLITLGGLVPAWRGSRAGTQAVIVSRLVAVLFAIPVFFTDAAPNWARLAVSVTIAVTALGVGLLVLSGRSAPARAAR